MLDPPIGAKNGNEGTVITFDANATDDFGDTLTYSLGAGAPAGAAINASSGVFTWTPTEAQGRFFPPNTAQCAGRRYRLHHAYTEHRLRGRVGITANEVNQNPVVDAQPRSVAWGCGLVGPPHSRCSCTNADLPPQTLLPGPPRWPSARGQHQRVGVDLSGDTPPAASPICVPNITVTAAGSTAPGPARLGTATRSTLNNHRLSNRFPGLEPDRQQVCGPGIAARLQSQCHRP